MIIPKNTPPMLTMDDVYVGQTLICIWSDWNVYHVGGEYKVLKKCYHDPNTYEQNFIYVNSDSPLFAREFYRLSDLNHPDINSGYFVRFVPEEFLTKSELFLFKLSGKIPERFL